MPKTKLMTLQDFEELYGEELFDTLLFEHLLLMREEVKRFRLIEEALSKKSVTIDEIRELLD